MPDHRNRATSDDRNARNENLLSSQNLPDNGVGFPKKVKNDSGMGLQIMKYRAGMIGATLDIRSGNGEGTTVVCGFRNNL